MSDYWFAAVYLQDRGYPEHPNDVESFERKCKLHKVNPEMILIEMKAIIDDDRARWEKERARERDNAESLDRDYIESLCIGDVPN